MISSEKTKLKKGLTETRLIALGFFIAIFLGGLLLSLPVASKSGESTPFINALFTATSATCVTGLAVYDTFLHWSLFGQIVILCLIQIGGLGLMTVITLFAVFLKRRIGLHERRLLVQSAGTMRLSGVVALVRRIAAGTFIFEGVGAVLLATRFCPKMGFGAGIYNAVFHSVSAFCNAGFDLMGRFSPFSSFIGCENDPVIVLTLSALIVIGGIGFFVWNDIVKNCFHFSRYELHSKIALSATAGLLFSGFILFIIFERKYSFAGMTKGETVLAAIFQSVTPRTAGFSIVDSTKLSESGTLLTIILMFIGGCPGSTAGGIKVTTFVVLLLDIICYSRRTNEIVIFKRRLEDGVAKHASAIASIYLLAILIGTMIICDIEVFSLKAIVYEVVSAIATVGLSEGITPHLGSISKIILILLMYAGRIGGLSLALVLAERRDVPPLKRPTEKILIG